MFASGTERRPADASARHMHIPFKLKKGGGQITLQNSTFEVVQTLAYPALADDVSYGLVEDVFDRGATDPNYALFLKPSPPCAQ